MNIKAHIKEAKVTKISEELQKLGSVVDDVLAGKSLFATVSGVAISLLWPRKATLKQMPSLPSSCFSRGST
jgi:hypothetical protein